ncbi:MAG: ATP synthase F1 subunit gamma [Acidobacteriota bacterium]
MPAGNLIDLRRRVRSVGNISQITRAMKFISASRLKRAEDRIFAARPYAARMLAVLNSLATRVEASRHPLLAQRDGKNIMLVVVTADKGLCGAFNHNIVKAAMHYIGRQEAGKTVRLTMVGRKGHDWFQHRPWPIQHRFTKIMNRVQYRHAREIAGHVIEYYTSTELDAVYVVYNEFKSVIQQNVVIEPLLPIERLEIQGSAAPLDYLYEQPPAGIFDRLLPRHVETQIFRAMLESEAAEHGARMTAMDAATRNAKDVIERLTLRMNRIRQASITTELIEIVSGADALQEAE